jgi:plasmid maintenance system antidote protein VapI
MILSRRLPAALGTHPSFWYDLQASHEFAQARRKKIPKIAPFGQAASRVGAHSDGFCPCKI